MSPRDIRATGAQIILGNTFHLWLRPGTAIIAQHGDLHGASRYTLLPRPSQDDDLLAELLFCSRCEASPEKIDPD